MGNIYELFNIKSQSHLYLKDQFLYFIVNECINSFISAILLFNKYYFIQKRLHGYKFLHLLSKQTHTDVHWTGLGIEPVTLQL